MDLQKYKTDVLLPIGTKVHIFIILYLYYLIYKS